MHTQTVGGYSVDADTPSFFLYVRFAKQVDPNPFLLTALIRGPKVALSARGSRILAITVG
jgi:hypothetical protein